MLNSDLWSPTPKLSKMKYFLRSRIVEHCDSVEGQLTKLLLISHSILLSRLDARCTSRLHHGR